MYTSCTCVVEEGVREVFMTVKSLSRVATLIRVCISYAQVLFKGVQEMCMWVHLSNVF